MVSIKKRNKDEKSINCRHKILILNATKLDELEVQLLVYNTENQTLLFQLTTKVCVS